MMKQIDAQYMQGTLKRKLQLLCFIAATVLLVVSIKALFRHLETGNTGQNLLTVIHVNILIHALLLPIYAVGALCFYRFAKRVQSSQQYPPPGAEMAFTKKIIKGKKSLVQAYGFYGFALLLIIQGISQFGFQIYMAYLLRDIN